MILKLWYSHAISINLDFEKAYDRVNRSYMLKTLTAFGFGPSFISMIRLMYTNREFALVINGKLGSWWPANRGVVQGCPLSQENGSNPWY